METLLLVLDLVGTFVFALSGAMAGVMHRLDLFGVLVLSKEAKSGGCALNVGGLPTHHPRRPAYQDPTRCRT